MNRRLGAAAVVLLGLTASVDARPRSVIVDQDIDPGVLTEQGLVPYNTIFLNRCASGCTITPGTSNSIMNRWPISGTGTLTAFPYGDAVWTQVVECVKDVFEPYKVQITDVDPGSANHFEIMIAGSPGQVGMSSNIGGVAPGSGTSCSSYLNNALVFDFADVWGSNGTCDAGCVEDLCATAAQEIGHTWQRMDHVTENTDPMTYFGSTTRKYFQNTAAQCGSDCVQGVAPGNKPCVAGSGSVGNPQEHTCTCGGNTQNSHNVILGLFGPGPGTPPVVNISAPKANASVTPGFGIYSEATDNSGKITKVELVVDGVMTSMLLKPPFVFNAPESLANGPHKVEVIAYDPHGVPGKASVEVIVGPPCTKPSDCSNDTDTCVGGRCVPGAGVQGGLGSTCTANTECASGQCGDDGSDKYCVETCAVGDCPDGFGCSTADGAATGVCWPGFDDGSGGGGCGCRSNDGAPLGMLAFLGVIAMTTRRRRARAHN